MFFYASSSKFTHALRVFRLSEESNDDCLKQVAEWIEKQWGYLRNFPGLTKRKEMTKTLADEIFLLKYAGQPIGMFRLCDYESLNPKINAKELTHVYVDESFRGLGVGSRLVKIAKEIARRQGADLIVFDTLSPNLNHFYERHGASVVCENQFLGAPAERLKLIIKR